MADGGGGGGGFRFYTVFICISCLFNRQCSVSSVSDISVSYMTATTASREENLIPSIHKHSVCVCVRVLSPLSSVLALISLEAC